jgi:predicted Zn-ribbon and HTH transcriptional regulator
MSQTEYQREYYEKNKDRILAAMKDRREKNPEHVQEIARKSGRKHGKERWQRRRLNEQHKIYQKEYNLKHYAMRKARFDQLKVAGCSLCGYNVHPSALDFHHRYPEEKTWKVNQFMNRGFEEAKAETEKCILLCANCHRLMHIVLDDSLKVGGV